MIAPEPMLQVNTTLTEQQLMNKTITMLLALAGVASADYSGSFFWETGNIKPVDNMPGFIFSDGNERWLYVSELKINDEVMDMAAASEKPSAVYPGSLTPEADVGSGNSWSMSFSIVNYSAEKLTLGGHDAGCLCLRGGRRSLG